MVIKVNSTRTLGEVQDAFTASFPALKLVFFTKKQEAFQGTHSKFMLTDRNLTLGSVERNPRDGVLHIEADMPTWQLERLFEQEFGLHVQVFRKSGNIWLMTTVSDSLTLEEQNFKGLESLRHHADLGEISDYREQD
jgi:hypothetical protein